MSGSATLLATNTYNFTGYEQARLAQLLLILTVLSILVWVIVGLSTCARFGALFLFGRQARSRQHQDTSAADGGSE